jgi:hypothetical protein
MRCQFHFLYASMALVANKAATIRHKHRAIDKNSVVKN